MAHYVVRNWPSYDRSLARRGDLTIWIAPDVIGDWRGAERQTYSDPRSWRR